MKQEIERPWSVGRVACLFYCMGVRELDFFPQALCRCFGPSGLLRRLQEPPFFAWPSCGDPSKCHLFSSWFPFFFLSISPASCWISLPRTHHTGRQLTPTPLPRGLISPILPSY